jgi:hypothetical protein
MMDDDSEEEFSPRLVSLEFMSKMVQADNVMMRRKFLLTGNLYLLCKTNVV